MVAEGWRPDPRAHVPGDVSEEPFGSVVGCLRGKS
jgi:hypothetical protein